MTINIKVHSRLRFASLLETGGVTYWDTLELPDLPVQSDDLQYTVRSTDRIDLLAFRFYGDSLLWWVIAEANDFEILPTDLFASDVIRIPSPRFVLQALFSTKKRQNG